MSLFNKNVSLVLEILDNYSDLCNSQPNWYKLGGKTRKKENQIDNEWKIE